jgi:putative FmdB family regulatory protein
MPIYAYRCTECGHALDVLRKISDPALTVCPACGQPALVKQVTAAGFQLKGSGWYVTDFRGDKKAVGKAAEGDAAGKTGDGNGDTAPANEGAKSGEAAKAGATGEAAGKAAAAPAAPAAPAAAPPASAPAPAAAPTPSAPGKSGA